MRQLKRLHFIGYTFTAIIILFLGLVVRLFLAPEWGYDYDLQLFRYWGLAAYRLGAPAVYQLERPPDHPPLYIYVLQFLSYISFKFLGSHPSDGELSGLQRLVFKLPSIISDIITSTLLILLASRKMDFKRSVFLMTIYLFNPGIFYDSAIWGQNDSLLTLFLFLSFIFIEKRKNNLANIFLGLSICTKFWALGLLPIFYIVSWKMYGLRKTIGGFVFLLLTLFTVWSPILAKIAVSRLINILFWSYGLYPQTSVGAFNIWIFKQSSDKRIAYHFLCLNLNYQVMGAVMCLISILAIAIGIFRNRNIPYYYCYLTSFSTFMFLTRMHERYLHPVFIFLLTSLIFFRNKTPFLYIYTLLSLNFFLNLYINLRQPTIEPFLNLLSFSIVQPMIAVTNIVSFIISLLLLYLPRLTNS